MLLSRRPGKEPKNPWNVSEYTKKITRNQKKNKITLPGLGLQKYEKLPPKVQES